MRVAPQLAILAEEPPRTGQWRYEAKFDGYRVMARIDGGSVRLITRGGHDWTDRMPRLADALSTHALSPTWLDGEVVVFGADGLPDFQALQNAFDRRSDADIRYCVFDLPYYGGRDLRQLPVAARRELLAKLVRRVSSPTIVLSEDLGSDGEALLRHACELGLEGLIGKRQDAPYRSGRTQSWIKLKCRKRQAFTVGGFTDPDGSRSGFGSLLLGIRDDDGRLVFAGNVGTGFSEPELERLRAMLERLRTARAPFVVPPADAGVHWVEPRLVADVSYSQWTREGRLRHAVYHGLLDGQPSPRTPATIVPVPPAISNPDRVIDPASGTAKLDLIRHYEAAARWMLPHLAARPVALLRAPTGIGEQTFFQKHPATLRIPGIRVLTIDHRGEADSYIEIPSREALVGAAQMNAIEFHTWNATMAAIEAPDRMIFDLDPGDGVDFQAVREAALMVREFLDALGLQSFVKTSGGRGLHVVVPCRPRHGWEVVKRFSRRIVVHVAGVVPERFVAKSGPANRVGRIFVDYLRNGRGATTVAAYSARARPGVGVSMPIRWEELAGIRDGNHWTIANARRRLASLRRDPWHGYHAGQELAPAMRRLGFSPDR